LLIYLEDEIFSDHIESRQMLICILHIHEYNNNNN